VWGRTATELAAGLRARELSAREVMESHLARIEAVNPRVNAIVTLLEPEEALALADAADAGTPGGVLHGLPLAVKDLEDTAGMRTT
jgi:amidase